MTATQPGPPHPRHPCGPGASAWTSASRRARLHVVTGKGGTR
jgi:hypothetical protein